MIPLIQNQDNFERIRDKIAEILATETALQQALATAALEDPDDWKFLVYAERSRPWELYLDESETTPIVNVWYDSDQFDTSTSNSETRQATISRYNIDCFAVSPAVETVGGHTPGDENAAKMVHRIARLVRRILMHPDYESLGFSANDDPVWYRRVTNRTAFQPRISNAPALNIMGYRIVLEVKHNEFIDLAPEETMEEINIKLHHEPDGLVRAELLFEE